MSSDIGRYGGFSRAPHSVHQLIVQYCVGGSTVLDVGCWTGQLARELREHGDPIVDGIEKDYLAAEEARKFCRHVWVGDVETMDLDRGERYDRIVCADIIEHCLAPQRLLIKLRPLLSADGRLIVSTPNVANWELRTKLLLGRWDYQDRGLLDRTHVHLFTHRTLITALNRAGYIVTNENVSANIFGLRRPVGRTLAHRLALAWRGLLAYQFVVEAVPCTTGSR